MKDADGGYIAAMRNNPDVREESETTGKHIAATKRQEADFNAQGNCKDIKSEARRFGSECNWCWWIGHKEVPFREGVARDKKSKQFSETRKYCFEERPNPVYKQREDTRRQTHQNLGSDVGTISWHGLHLGVESSCVEVSFVHLSD